MQGRKGYLNLCVILVIMVMVADCAGKKAPEALPPPPEPVKKQRVQKKLVDPQAQQRHYDLGLKYYADEDYEEAKKAFQQAVEYGPDTSLGIKARENLLKTEQVLKTLRELE